MEISGVFILEVMSLLLQGDLDRRTSSNVSKQQHGSLTQVPSDGFAGAPGTLEWTTAGKDATATWPFFTNMALKYRT
jgi:hypothetical protein